MAFRWVENKAVSLIVMNVISDFKVREKFGRGVKRFFVDERNSLSFYFLVARKKFFISFSIFF